MRSFARSASARRKARQHLPAAAITAYAGNAIVTARSRPASIGTCRSRSTQGPSSGRCCPCATAPIAARSNHEPWRESGVCRPPDVGYRACVAGSLACRSSWRSSRWGRRPRRPPRRATSSSSPSTASAGRRCSAARARSISRRRRTARRAPPRSASGAATAEARRAVLMPFVWGTMATKGQIFGDPSRQSRAHLTNGLWFSYPGYNEMFSGAADPRIDSNDKVPNPNITVLEWLNAPPRLQRPGRRVRRVGRPAVDPEHGPQPHSRGLGFRARAVADDGARARDQRACRRTCRPTGSTGRSTRRSSTRRSTRLRTTKPRVLYIMLGEGDEWAHGGRYDLYLDAAFRADRFIRSVWDVAPVAAGVRESDDAAGDDRSWPRRDDRRLERPRQQGAGGGNDLVRGARTRRGAARRARRRDGDDVAARRDDRRRRRRRLPRGGAGRRAAAARYRRPPVTGVRSAFGPGR